MSNSKSCNNCKKEEPEVDLKRCSGCKEVWYCCVECQRINWKVHKKPCRKKRAPPPMFGRGTGRHWADGILGDDERGVPGPSPPRGLDQAISWPFTRLMNGTFLHDRSEKDVYRILIDSYRFRMEEHCFTGHAPEEGSIYADLDDSLPGFRRYLKMAQSRDGLLPPWWSPEKQRECEALGMSETEFQDLRMAVEKFAIIGQYYDSRFPWQLRMLAEAIYGWGLEGNGSFSMRNRLAEMEAVERAEEEARGGGSGQA